MIYDSDRGSAIRLDRCVFTLYYWPLGLVKQNMNRGSISSPFAVKMIQRLGSSECRTEIPIQMGHGSNSRSAYVYKFHLASGVRRLAFKYGHILPRECKRSNHPWHRFTFNRPFCSFLSWHRGAIGDGVTIFNLDLDPDGKYAIYVVKIISEGLRYSA